MSKKVYWTIYTHSEYTWVFQEASLFPLPPKKACKQAQAAAEVLLKQGRQVRIDYTKRP